MTDKLAKFLEDGRELCEAKWLKTTRSGYLVRTPELHRAEQMLPKAFNLIERLSMELNHRYPSSDGPCPALSGGPCHCGLDTTLAEIEAML